MIMDPKLPKKSVMIQKNVYVLYVAKPSLEEKSLSDMRKKDMELISNQEKFQISIVLNVTSQ